MGEPRRELAALPSGVRAASGTAAAGRRRAIVEVLALWLVTLLLIRGVKVLVQGAGFPEVFLAAVPILFMYAPVLLCRIRGVDSWDYPLALPAFRDRRAWTEALKLNAVVIGILIVPWLFAYHVYQTQLFPWAVEALGLGPAPDHGWRGTWPPDLPMLVAYHLFFVAIPEELFYRGYVQTRLDEVIPPRWRLFGATVGPGLLITSVVFAFGHSLVDFQWWHFAIFFPSLVFGWMRARTGGIVAGAFFHAWANVQITILDTLYGVLPPGS